MSSLNTLSLQEFTQATEAEQRTMLKRMNKDTRGNWMLSLALACSQTQRVADQLNERLIGHQETIAKLESEKTTATNEIVELQKDVEQFQELYNNRVDLTPILARLARREYNVE